MLLSDVQLAEIRECAAGATPALMRRWLGDMLGHIAAQAEALDAADHQRKQASLAVVIAVERIEQLEQKLIAQAEALADANSVIASLRVVLERERDVIAEQRGELAMVPEEVLQAQAEAATAKEQIEDVLRRSGDDVLFWHTLADERSAVPAQAQAEAAAWWCKALESEERAHRAQQDNLSAWTDTRQAQAEAAALREALVEWSTDRAGYCKMCFRSRDDAHPHTDGCCVGIALSGTAGQALLDSLAKLKAVLAVVRRPVDPKYTTQPATIEALRGFSRGVRAHSGYDPGAGFDSVANDLESLLATLDKEGKQ